MTTRHHGFLRDEIQDDHWTHGQGNAGRTFGAASANPGGSWKKWLPEKELQNRNGLETMACTVFGSLNAYETLATFHGFQDFPKNCAERFSAILAGITRDGGSPHRTCESIRQHGVIPEGALPWKDERDWDHFYAPNPMTADYLALGAEITRKFLLGHEWVWKDGETDKPGKLKAMLERAPVCVSVDAWHKKDGLYVKQGPDNHWVMITDYRDGQWWEVFDHYDSIMKRVPWDTDFEQAKAYFLARRDEIPNLIVRLQRQAVELLTQFLALLRSEVPASAPVQPVVPVPAPIEETVLPAPEPLRWDTVEAARHSVRVICDEEGLTVQQKNELCATVGAESGWQSYYLSGSKKGQPVKLENKNDVGNVWSTDWGIIQLNDWYHIGPGKSFPSVEYVLSNPEACIRWMCTQWKAGHANWWIAHKNGSYKKFL